MSLGFGRIIRYGVRHGLKSKAGFSRRDFLRRGASVAAAAAVGGCAGRARRESGMRGAPRVAVVGAGFAGLACADALARNGADVRVFEATHRPGGRVLTNRHFIPDRNVEFGAEFIGMNHPTWNAYAERFGLDLTPAVEYEGDSILLLDGEIVRGEAADALYEEIDELAAILIDLARPIDANRPWKSPNAAELDRTSYADFLASTSFSPRARQLAAVIAAADNGVEAGRMSMLATLAMVAGGGFEDYFQISETHRAAAGNDALARALADGLGSCVRYGSPVSSIRRTGAHAVVVAGREAPFECDAVVLAVAPSVWHRIDFQNPLGSSIPQMGKNTKLITKLRSPVWEENDSSPELIADELVQLTWISAEGGEGRPKSFTLFSGADQCQRLRDVPARLRLAEATASIRAAYPSLADAVIESRFIDWPGMLNAMASYSFPAPGEVTRFGPILVDGWDDGLVPLRFAGEHTSYGFIGYMEGALQSGIRAAEQVLAPRAAAVANG